MKFKRHPRAVIEVYVDGRVALTILEESKSFKDVLAVRCMRVLLANHWERLGKELEPDRYEFKLDEFQFRNSMGFFELTHMEPG